MNLCIDIGNTQIFAGVIHGDEILLRFRHNTREGLTSDQLGIFLKTVLRENHVDPNNIEDIAICSVVPHLEYSIRSACLKYFDIDPLFLQAGVKTGLKIKYRNPIEVGADRIANAIAAKTLYPNKDTIIIDYGTATTFCVLTAASEYLGGAILSGIRLSMESLQNNAAKLSAVEILRPKQSIGRSTMESIQSGLYYSQVGVARELIQKISEEHFSGKRPFIIATGGFSHLFENEGLFNVVHPDLVLHGLDRVLRLNR
jgi:type III pantothenate kinase